MDEKEIIPGPKLHTAIGPYTKAMHEKAAKEFAEREEQCQQKKSLK